MGSQNMEQEITRFVTEIALAGDGAVLGLGLAVFAVKTWLKYYSHSYSLRKLKDAPLTHIPDLKSLLSSDTNDGHNHDPRTCLSTSSDAPIVLVRGVVHPSSYDRVITAPNSGVRAVVFVKSQTCLYNEWRGLFGWRPSWRVLLGGSLKEPVATTTRQVPFVLVGNDKQQKPDYVHINLGGASQPLPLTTVYHQLHPVPATPYTVFQAFFGRGYPVGLLDQEKILPPGKEITAVGHLYTANDNNPAIKSCKFLPYFLSDLTKEQLVEEIEFGKGILFWSGILLTASAAFVLTYSAIRNWQRFQEWRQRREQRRQIHDEPPGAPPPASNTSDEDDDVPEGQLCVVCLTNRRRSAFIPCGHHVCCPGCARRVERDSNPKCPVCRQNVRNSVRIYES